MSNSVRPHRWQPNRILRPWDSPGKRVGCHFLLQCMKVKSEREVTQSCLTFCDLMDCSPPGSSVHGIFQARVLEWGAISFSGYMPWWPPNSTTGYITDRNACPPASKDMHKRAHSKLFMIVLTQSSSTVGWVNEWWCCLTMSSSDVSSPFCLQSFPASGSFPMSQLLTSSGQSIGTSA